MIEEILNKVYTSELLSSEELHILTEWICDKDKEIERLNNIINELEKWLEKSDFRCPDDLYVSACNEALDKIKELKGSDKAIPPEIIGTNGEDGGLFDYGDR